MLLYWVHQFTDCQYAKCQYAKCQYAECQYAELYAYIVVSSW
jgi:hypothetical protein